MPSISTRFTNLTRSISNTSSKSARSYYSIPPPQYEALAMPVPLTLSTSTLGSEPHGSTSRVSDFAEMLDDDNLAWGSPKSKKSKHFKW